MFFDKNATMINQETEFEEYDEDVFEAVIHKVIVGGDNKYGVFECDYNYFIFDYDLLCK